MKTCIMTRFFGPSPIPFPFSVPVDIAMFKANKRRALVRKAVRVIESDRLSCFAGRNMQPLTGGYWSRAAESECLVCHEKLGGLIVCRRCGYKMPDHLYTGWDASKVDTSQKCVEKAAESVHTESTNSCQKTTKLVETKQDQPTDLSCNEKTKSISINKLDDGSFINEGIKLIATQENACGGGHHHRYAGRFGE